MNVNEGYGNLISEEDVIGLINYGLQSERFKELRFFNCDLPAFIRPDTIPKTSNSRNIKVMWPSCASLLDLQSGKWKQADDIQTITELCSSTVVIDNDTSQSVQRSVIELLGKAFTHDIPILEVTLVRSFNKVDGDNIILWSGLSLPILALLEMMGIQTEAGREIKIEEVTGILNCVQQSKGFKELSFNDCLLPSSITGSFLSNLKSSVKVFWNPYGHYRRRYRLNHKSGYWKLYKETASLFPNKAIGETLTNADYAKEVSSFREHYRNHQWQKNRIDSTEQ